MGGSPFGPSSGALVFLPDPRIVLPPDLNLDALPKLCTTVGHPFPECLLKAGDRLLVLNVVTGTRGKLGIAHLAQHPSDRGFVKGKTEFIDQASGEVTLRCHRTTP